MPATMIAADTMDDAVTVTVTLPPLATLCALSISEREQRVESALIRARSDALRFIFQQERAKAGYHVATVTAR